MILLKGQTLCIPTLPRTQTVIPPTTTTTTTTVTQTTVARTVATTLVQLVNTNNCVPYTIAAGDSCLGIAAKFSITLNELFLANSNLSCSNLQIGKTICTKLIATTSVTVPTTAIANVGSTSIAAREIINSCVPYTIVAGDTCWDIAKRFCFPLSDISVLNPNINCNNLQVGEVICVKSATNTAINTNPIVQPSLPSNINNCVPYTIVAGDTCNAIAARYGLTLDQLYVLNPNVNCPHLQIGSKLCVQAIQANSIINPIVAPVNPVTQSPILAPVVRNCVPYYVVSGDTCWAIATRYGLTVSQLNSLNPNVNCANLQIGQVMCVRTTFSG